MTDLEIELSLAKIELQIAENELDNLNDMLILYENEVGNGSCGEIASGGSLALGLIGIVAAPATTGMSVLVIGFVDLTFLGVGFLLAKDSREEAVGKKL